MEMYLFGEMKDFGGSLTPADIGAILAEAHALKQEVARLSIDDILNVFDMLSRLWMDKDYPYTRQALERLPDLIGFSAPMVYEGIKTMRSLLRKINMQTRVTCDVGEMGYLDAWTYHPRFKGYMMAKPRGVVAHVSAGNVFVGGVDSLIQGLVTKNVNIMKMSTVDPLFPVLFAQSVKENDSTGILHRAMALLHWKGGDARIEAPLKRSGVTGRDRAFIRS